MLSKDFNGCSQATHSVTRSHHDRGILVMIYCFIQSHDRQTKLYGMSLTIIISNAHHVAGIIAINEYLGIDPMSYLFSE